MQTNVLSKISRKSDIFIINGFSLNSYPRHKKSAEMETQFLAVVMTFAVLHFTQSVENKLRTGTLRYFSSA